MELGHRFFPASGLELKHQLFLSLELEGFQTRTYTTRSPGSPACEQQVLGLVSLHDYMNQFLVMNLFIYMHPIVSVSPENSNRSRLVLKTWVLNPSASLKIPSLFQSFVLEGKTTLFHYLFLESSLFLRRVIGLLGREMSVKMGTGEA